MKRRIIKIDIENCNGCGLCIPNCPEGALRIIDGKARIISDLYCDGLGACIGRCPQGAISIEERQAQKYDERKVMENIVRQGINVIKAHLLHLQEHNQGKYLREAMDYLKENDIINPLAGTLREYTYAQKYPDSQCPGAKTMDSRGAKRKHKEKEDGS